MTQPTPRRSPILSFSSDPAPALVVRAADAFAFSSGLAASIGASLSLVASGALGVSDPASWAFLAGSGTFIIYSLDRLRDLDRDRAISPLRTAFVRRNRQRLYAAVCIAAIGFVATLLLAPPSIILLCLAIGLVGLFHRRLKQAAALKTAYVSLAWVAGCVGIPWLASGHASGGPWIAGILLASLAANLIASNLRDGRGEAREPTDRGDTVPVLGLARGGDTAQVLWLARGMAVLAITIALISPAALRALVWIPICEGLTLARFRPTERYGHIAVDGGLLVGALLASIHLEWAA